MSRKPTGRKRGAQPGNHNRLKHGLYAKRLPVEHELRLERLGLNRNPHTIDWIRVRLNRLLEQQEAAPAKDFLTYERAIQYYLNLLTRLIHRNRRLSRRTGIASAELGPLLAMLKDL